ncbi:TRAP transporter small permease subunit [Roseovarius sp. SCSIO 43702]|uniref:TRAP transporter small permease subunit n=1 Tax=Roseovarius sp. SCSIO 43702 TaxID=2823043 RepID=UPI001C733405|nr:TRAP transporter small permease subunit [Roseovarius sp. SCSIO 43702]QYX58418.1 TRAP transporter small permease subunit [Roseovarius sp. SCSIO 43702]
MRARFTAIGLGILDWAVIVLMLAIVAQVALSALDINPVASFDRALPLLGRGITLNSLLDLQWHLLVLIGLLPAGIVWLGEGHVRVDFLYQARSPRWQARTDLIGHALFAVPFFALMVPASSAFMLRAWSSDEGGRNGGLDDLWLVKSLLPLGLALLAAAILVETWRLLRRAR